MVACSHNISKDENKMFVIISNDYKYSHIIALFVCLYPILWLGFAKSHDVYSSAVHEI